MFYSPRLVVAHSHLGLVQDILIRNRFRVDRKIGEGGHGMVYMGPLLNFHQKGKRLTDEGADTDTGREVAIKLSDYGNAPQVLENEGEIYNALGSVVGIPKVIWTGEQDRYTILVLELLGPSLEDLFNYCDRKFSLKTILLIADQAILRLQRIHRRVIHRDIKPENFALGTGRHGNMLYTIDFGLAKEFPDSRTNDEPRDSLFYGTPHYASINHHKGHGENPNNSTCQRPLLTRNPPKKNSPGGMTWNLWDTCSSTLLAVRFHGTALGIGNQT